MENTLPRRRWFQFGLATLLWLILLIALTIIGVIDYRMRARVISMEAEVERLTSRNATVENEMKKADRAERNLRERLVEAGLKLRQANAAAASAPLDSAIRP
jgi:cell division protein FtsL